MGGDRFAVRNGRQVYCNGRTVGRMQWVVGVFFTALVCARPNTNASIAFYLLNALYYLTF